MLAPIGKSLLSILPNAIILGIHTPSEELEELIPQVHLPGICSLKLLLLLGQSESV